MSNGERYSLNVIVRPSQRTRHGFVVIEDHTTEDHAAVFDGPNALIDAVGELARLTERERY